MKPKVFVWDDWDAYLLESAKQVKETFNEYHVLGRKITRIRSLSYGYNFANYYLAQDVYDYENLEEKGWNGWDDDEELIQMGNPNMPVSRFAVIDRPLLLTFDNGDVLEFQFNEFNKVFLGLNTLPKDILPGKGTNVNFDANKLFSCVLGKKIIDIVLDNTEDDEVYRITFVFEDQVRLVFCFECLDYGTVVVQDKNHEDVPISYGELLSEVVINR